MFGNGALPLGRVTRLSEINASLESIEKSWIASACNRGSHRSPPPHQWMRKHAMSSFTRRCQWRSTEGTRLHFSLLCHLVDQVSGSGSILSSNCATACGGLFLRSRPTSTGCGRVNGQSGHFRPGAMIVVRSRMAANEWPKNIPAAVHLTPKAVLRAPGPGSHEQSLNGQLPMYNQILARNCEGRPRGHPVQ